jgi:hypothetical protein
VYLDRWDALVRGEMARTGATFYCPDCARRVLVPHRCPARPSAPPPAPVAEMPRPRGDAHCPVCLQHGDEHVGHRQQATEAAAARECAP